MKRLMRHPTVTIATTILLTAGVAGAQTPRAPDDLDRPDPAAIETKFATNPLLERMEAGARATFRSIDLNGDGIVTLDELVADRQQSFIEIDTNENGTIMSGEYMSFYARRSRENLPPLRAGAPPELGEARISDYFWKVDVQKAFNRLDKNLNRVLSRPEWVAPAFLFVAQYDLNRDEIVEEDEYVMQVLPNTRRPPPPRGGR